MAEIPLTMPKMSMTMEEGTITEWQVAEGDQIAKGDVVAVVMTDKVDMEVESPAAGVITELLHAEGDAVAVGDRIALIASQEEDLLGDLFSGDGGGAAAAAGEAGHEPQPPEQGAAHAQSAGPTPNAGGSAGGAAGPQARQGPRPGPAHAHPDRTARHRPGQGRQGGDHRLRCAACGCRESLPIGAHALAGRPVARRRAADRDSPGARRPRRR